MLMGLKEGQEKMSKSDPDSAIFMEDTEADVKRKIKQVRPRICINHSALIMFDSRSRSSLFLNVCRHSVRRVLSRETHALTGRSILSSGAMQRSPSHGSRRMVETCEWASHRIPSNVCANSTCNRT